MDDILKHIVRYWSFLWLGARYRIIDSMVSTHFGGDAYLVVASDSLRLRFVRDRGQLFLDLQPAWAAKQAEWYSSDLVHRLVVKKTLESAELSDRVVRFFSENLRDIEALFATREAFKVTKVELDRLKNIRAKEMFPKGEA